MGKNIKKLTESGIICALSLMWLVTGIIPGIIYFSINMSIGTLTIIQKRYGTKQWILCYIAVSILGMLIIPDLDVSLTNICMGWYPLIKNKLDKLNIILRVILKNIIFVLASTIIYYISISVFGTEAITDAIPFFIVFYVIAFSILFWMLELILKLFNTVICKRIIKILDSATSNP